MFFPLLSSSRLFFFFPHTIFTWFPRLPNFPPSSRLFFFLLPDLPDLGAVQEEHPTIHLQLQRQAPLQPKFSDPTCIGGLKNRLRFFLGALKTLAWGHFCRHEIAISHIALKNLTSKKHTPFFDPLPIGLAKTPLQIFSW